MNEIIQGHVIEQLVVSVELAKRMKRLDFPQNTFWSWYVATDRDDTPRINRTDEHCSVCTLPKQSFEDKFAAPTSEEVWQELPSSYGSMLFVEKRIYASHCGYEDVLHQNIEHQQGETLSETLGLMWCYLKERGLI